MQPGSGGAPTPFDSGYRDLVQLGDFFYCEAAEIAQFDQPCVFWRDLREIFQSFVQRVKVNVARYFLRDFREQRNFGRPTLFSTFVAYLIDQNLPHDLARVGKKVGPITRRNSLLRHQLERCAVNQFGRRYPMACPVTHQEATGQATQLLVHLRNDLIARRRIALFGSAKQLGNGALLTRRGGHVGLSVYCFDRYDAMLWSMGELRITK